MSMSMYTCIRTFEKVPVGGACVLKKTRCVYRAADSYGVPLLGSWHGDTFLAHVHDQLSYRKISDVSGHLYGVRRFGGIHVVLPTARLRVG